MSDEEKVEEPIAQETEQKIEQPQVEEQEVKAPENVGDKNWDQARYVLAMQKQRIEELEARLTPPKIEEKDEFSELDPEDYLTVAKARQMAEKLAEKKAEAAAKKYVQEYAQQQQISVDEQRVRAKFDDYDYVIENYAVPLIKTDPALAMMIQKSKNPAETAYKLGRFSDQYEEQQVKQPTSPKAEKIIKNSQRPVSGNAVGVPLKGQADQFAKMSPQEIWQMSQKYARGS